MIGNDIEGGGNGLVQIITRTGSYGSLHSRNEFIFAPDLGHRIGGAISFKVNTPNKSRELCRKLSALVYAQTVAQNMQCRAEQVIGTLFIVPAQLIHDFIDPDVRVLN